VAKNRLRQVGRIDVGLWLAGTVVWFQVAQGDIAVQADGLHHLGAHQPAKLAVEPSAE
jgi:hypothetical protein